VKVVVAITGSSGSVYGIRLLRALQGEKVLIVSETGRQVLEYETKMKIEEVTVFADRYYPDDELFAPVASGSVHFDAMIVAPCSESTLAKIAGGIADTLITRTASVALKEGRKLIMVPRETPVNAIMLENELKLARLGVVILPASPGFYGMPQSVEDMVDFVVGKVLDQLGQPNDLYRRWGK
jgi:flavin prenyltransferase